ERHSVVETGVAGRRVVVVRSWYRQLGGARVGFTAERACHAVGANREEAQVDLAAAHDLVALEEADGEAILLSCDELAGEQDGRDVGGRRRRAGARRRRWLLARSA